MNEDSTFELLKNFLSGKVESQKPAQKPSKEELQNEIKMTKDPKTRKKLQEYLDNYDEMATMPINVIGNY